MERTVWGHCGEIQHWQMRGAFSHCKCNPMSKFRFGHEKSVDSHCIAGIKYSAMFRLRDSANNPAQAGGWPIWSTCETLWSLGWTWSASSCVWSLVLHLFWHYPGTGSADEPKHGQTSGARGNNGIMHTMDYRLGTMRGLGNDRLKLKYLMGIWECLEIGNPETLYFFIVAVKFWDLIFWDIYK